MATNNIIPIAIKYQNKLIKNIKGLKDILDTTTFKRISANQINTITDISKHISEIQNNNEMMTEVRKKANKIADTKQKAFEYNEKVLPYFDKIRKHVDSLELLVDNELWPLPKYRELLFTK